MAENKWVIGVITPIIILLITGRGPFCRIISVSSHGG